MRREMPTPAICPDCGARTTETKWTGLGRNVHVFVQCLKRCGWTTKYVSGGA